MSTDAPAPITRLTDEEQMFKEAIREFAEEGL